MGDYNIKSLGEAIKAYIAAMKLEEKFSQATLINDWEMLVGHTIAASTTEITLRKGVLYVKFSSAALKHEIMIRREALRDKINNHYQSEVVKSIRVG